MSSLLHLTPQPTDPYGTETEWLMSAEPGTNHVPAEQRLANREQLLDIIEATLDEHEMELFNLIAVERLSFRQAAVVYVGADGQTWSYRGLNKRYHRVLEKLRGALDGYLG